MTDYETSDLFRRQMELIVVLGAVVDRPLVIFRRSRNAATSRHYVDRGLKSRTNVII